MGKNPGYRNDVCRCSNDNIQPFQLSFELHFQLQIELEGNLLDQNLNDLENELSRI